jgi:putative ABC transport system permease protein
MNQTFLFPSLLWKIGWRYLWRHSLQTILMISGIALGVAVVVAIDLANASASRAFAYSTESVAGRATHRISAGTSGLDESIYTTLRRQSGMPPLAPVVSDYVSSPQIGSRTLQLLGVDAFAEAPFRGYLGSSASLSVGQLSAFLIRPGGLLISKPMAERYNLKLGDSLAIDVGGRDHPAFIAGLLQPADSISQRALDGLILADIATAQEMTGKIGKLDWIDLIIPSSDTTLVQRLSSMLPAGAHLETVETRNNNLDQLTTAFRVNLTALSLLALVVGLFLIYNTMTFTVVQRRPLFGAMRCLGITRREIFILVVSEALSVGLIGGILGIGLGILMGQTTIHLILRTINDLYFTTTVSQVGLPVSSLLKGGLVGIFATLFTALPPAWEAASVPPRVALSRSGLESKARRTAIWSVFIGLVFILAGIGIFLLPFRDVVSGFSGTITILLGFALLSAFTLVLSMRLIAPLTSRLFGFLGRMAPRNLVNTLSRTAVAVAALMVAVSVSIGVGLMISSFRYTVEAWLNQSLQGDIYLSAPLLTANTTTIPIDPAILPILKTWPGVERVDVQRSVTVDSMQGPLSVSATSNVSVVQERQFLTLDAPPQEVWQAMQMDTVIVSEPLANRLNLPRQGGTLTLYTDNGPHTFKVAGIYYDYASSQGIVTMSLGLYQQLWKDAAITAIALRLQPGVSNETVARALQDAHLTDQHLIIRPNQALRKDVLVIFDNTFAITSSLQVLATVVAFIGVLSALLLLQLEKQREIGILRAIGLTGRQLWGLVMLETGLMGSVAGLLAVPTGYALALILVYIINRRSFGWTLQLAVQPLPFLLALGVALAAALLAGIYPAFRLGRMITAEAIRYE